VDVGGCSWEGASRFVKFIGNYVRNAGTVAMGNVSRREATLEDLPTGQHIVADNVFESNVPYGSCMINAQQAATQMIIRNNLFINFNSSAITLSSATHGNRYLPAEFATITGNILDMTCQAETSKARTAIDVSASDTIISDNQIYVRGQYDPQVTGIRLAESALHVGVHDNLIRHCGVGIVSNRVGAAVSEVVDGRTFLTPGRAVPLERRQSHRYRLWNLAWLSGSQPQTLSTIEAFDPETLQFKLARPHAMKVGDRFEVFPPSANWNLHDNTITGCAQPVTLDNYGSETSLFRDNIISRGEAQGVQQAVVVSGRFQFTGTHISGFDEKDSAALTLNPDGLGRPCPSVYRDNVFQGCTAVLRENGKGLWESSTTEGNVFIDCAHSPPQETTQRRRLPGYELKRKQVRVLEDQPHADRPASQGRQIGTGLPGH
jgi:hypothetical protein